METNNHLKIMKQKVKMDLSTAHKTKLEQHNKKTEASKSAKYIMNDETTT